MEAMLREYIPQIEAAARGLGLDYYPVDFELVPPGFMMESTSSTFAVTSSGVP